MKYVALLRGINAGGKNLIKMEDLRSAFMSEGYGDVKTYIQSGNVIFDSPVTNMDVLANKIETLLSDKFGYSARIVLKSFDGMRKVIAQAPPLWVETEGIRCSVAFISPPLTPDEVISHITLNANVDKVDLGFQVIYMTTLAEGITKSGFVRLVGTPIYSSLTIRNWNTTVEIFEGLCFGINNP